MQRIGLLTNFWLKWTVFELLFPLFFLIDIKDGKVGKLLVVSILKLMLNAQFSKHDSRFFQFILFY